MQPFNLSPFYMIFLNFKNILFFRDWYTIAIAPFLQHHFKIKKKIT